MNGQHILACLLLSLSVQPSWCAERCLIENHQPENSHPSEWLSQTNWLSPENLRIGLQSSQRFMPYTETRPAENARKAKTATRQIAFERIKIRDPLDPPQERTAEFVLDTRLYADGIVVLHNVKVVGERYWNGLTPQAPRLLLEGTRPILSLLGAIAVTQGKLDKDKSVIQHIPELSHQKGLRRLSLQRLLEGSVQFSWQKQDIESWKMASGWSRQDNASDVREWHKEANRWEAQLIEKFATPSDFSPEGDLLIWALNKRYNSAASRLLCDNILSKMNQESPTLWITDSQGHELSNGLAVSLRDFAKIGHLLVESRINPNRTRIPAWFIETLTASASTRKNTDLEAIGFEKGSDSRYGFVHLGGTPNRIAIVAPFGNSLYVDFDRRIVIALFASYPQTRTDGLIATLQETWKSLSMTIHKLQ